MDTAPQSDQLKEAIEELKKEFLDGIPTPPRPMAPFRWAGGKGEPCQVDCTVHEKKPYHPRAGTICVELNWVSLRAEWVGLRSMIGLYLGETFLP